MTIARTRNHRSTGDRGIAVVFFAISVTAMLAVGALVLGGSIGYTAVRNAQTAADAAAVAGATAIREHKQNWSEQSAGDIVAEITAVVASNGAVLAEDGCQVVNGSYALTRSESDVIADCKDIAGLDDPEFQSMAGVRVTVGDRRDVPFSAFVDRDTITGTAVAAATVQRYQDGLRAPFMLCAMADDHVVPLLEPAPDLDPPYRVNPAAVGEEFALWSNGNGFGDRNCGRSSWHGLVNPDVEYAVPSDPSDDSTWWDVDPGSKVGHLPRVLTGNDACTWSAEAINDSDVGCQLALPLCSGTVGNGTKMRLRCDRIATFEITFVGDSNSAGACIDTQNKKTVCAKMIAGGTALEGRGSTDPVDNNELSIVALVQ